MQILETSSSGSPLGSTCMLEHCNILPRNSSGCTLAGQMCIPSSSRALNYTSVTVLIAGRWGSFQYSPLFYLVPLLEGWEERWRIHKLITACIVPWHTLGLGFVLVSSSQWTQIRGKGEKVKQGGSSKSWRFLPVQLGVMIFLMYQDSMMLWLFLFVSLFGYCTLCLV